MATIGEKNMSISGGEGTGGTVNYVIRDAATEEIALATLKAFASTTREIDGIQCERKTFDVDSTELDTLWDGTVNYVEPENKERTSADEGVLSGSTAGGTQHITQGREHISARNAAGAIGDIHGGAIGVTNDGAVEGTDIVVAVDNFTLSFIVDDDEMTEEYIERLDGMVGTVNDAKFYVTTRKSGEAGELLFGGYDYSRRGKGDWELIFHFAKSKNVTGETVGDISGIDKDGWETLHFTITGQWFYREDDFDKLASNWV